MTLNLVRKPVAGKYDVPVPSGNGKPEEKPLERKKTITGQELLDQLCAAVIEDRVGIIETKEGDEIRVFLTVVEPRENGITLRTIGNLFPGGVTVVKGSSLTK